MTMPGMSLKPRSFVFLLLAIAATAWLLWFRPQSQVLTLVGIAIIVVSLIGLFVSLFRRPREQEPSRRTWWRLLWDGFWGL